MKTTTSLITSFSLLFLMSVPLAAQTPVVDAKTAEQAILNGVSAEAQESLIEKEYDQMKKEQNKVEMMLTIVERHLDKVEKIQWDVSAFRKEGAAIRLFAFKAKKALTSLGDLSKDLRGHELGVVSSFKVISSLSSDIYGICNGMVSTVVDAKFALPGLRQPKPKEEMNLLEPQERLAFYERCSYEMDLIIFKIQQMHYEILSVRNFNDAFAKIAPDAYWTVEYGKNIANDIISLWKK